ncbi:cytidylate kinase [Gammaproteobacteria bacterium]
MITNVPIITIDGPSSSGKGTISKLVAEKLGWHFLDSGAVYRTFALVIIKNNIQLNDIPALVVAASALNAEFIDQPGSPQKIILETEDVTNAIRHEECGVMASKTAAIAEVRAALTPFLRSFCRLPGLVADGRDMGTVVFPNARFKIFLTASAEERARRRFLQLQGSGINATLDAVLQGLMERDIRDESRVVAPLKPDSAAVIIDTTKLSVDEVLQLILAHAKTRF